MQNNLFYYATSELSQDAFLCWLLSYAQKDAKADLGLRGCAVNFIREIIPNLLCSDDEVFVTDIVRQYENIDILFTVNEKYVVIVEDKTHTSEHSNQLERYTQLIATDKKYGKMEIYKVFFKTGFQSNTDWITKSGFQFIGLEKIINLLAPYTDKTNNQIFLDYFSYWDNFNSTVMEYKNLPIEKWEWQHINGFYRDFKNSDALQQLGFYTDYGYVSNPRGGFFAMWFTNDLFLRHKGQNYELYLQLEFVDKMLQLCLKISIKHKEDEAEDLTPKQLRDFLTYYIDENGRWDYALKKYNYVKPTRFGTGQTMTLGVIPIKRDSWKEIYGVVSDSISNLEIIKSIESRQN